MKKYFFQISLKIAKNKNGQKRKEGRKKGWQEGQKRTGFMNHGRPDRIENLDLSFCRDQLTGSSTLVHESITRRPTAGRSISCHQNKNDKEIIG